MPRSIPIFKRGVAYFFDSLGYVKCPACTHARHVGPKGAQACLIGGVNLIFEMVFNGIKRWVLDEMLKMRGVKRYKGHFS